MSKGRRRALWVAGTVLCLTLAFVFVAVTSGSRPTWDLQCLKGLGASTGSSQLVQFAGGGTSPVRTMKVTTKIFVFRSTFEDFDRRAKADFQSNGNYLSGKLTAKPLSKYYSAATPDKRATVTMQIAESKGGQLKVIVTEFLEQSMMDNMLGWCRSLFRGNSATIQAR